MEGSGDSDGPLLDPDYDVIPRLPPKPQPKKGSQCGECSMKFDYNTAYGYCCPRQNCPTSFRSY